MINIDAKLKGDALEGLDRFEAKIRESVVLSGVAAMASVIYDEVKLNVSPPRMGRKTGNLESSIYRVYAKDRSSAVEKIYRVSWNKSKAPHGHLLEFGTSRAPAKPFIRPAFSKVDEAIRAGKERMADRMNEVD